MTAPPDRPRATYRLQFHAGFDFAAAERIVPYLAALGVSHVYASPIWRARPGSTHGYDVVDHAAVNPELGGRPGLERFAAALRAHGLGLIVDAVPNHMGIGYDNPWWVDVLAWGERSPFAGYFDIDWRPTEPTLAGKVLLPILGDHYGRVLADGSLVPGLDGGRLVVRYHEHTVPVAARDHGEVLALAARQAEGEAAATLDGFAALAQAIAGRRQRTSRQRDRADRDRAAALEAGLAEALEDRAVAAALDAALGAYGAGGPDPRAADRLHRLLERQAYRLAFWRLASQEINYRRFFDINDLAGLRMEVPALFEASHALMLELVGTGVVRGIRLDHVDGLLDPAAYLDRLRRATSRVAPDGRGVTLHVEKILGADEPLRPDWRIEGTTGYDALNTIQGLFVDPAGVRAAVRVFRAVTGDRRRFETIAVEAKRLIMRTALAAELAVLANGLNRLAKTSRDTRDYSLTGLREALANVVAHFPVYRSYVGPTGADEADRAVIGRAVRAARRAAATPDLSIYDFLEAVLTTDIAGQGRARQRPAARAAIALARKVQQYTGPVTAKAVEDTAFYRWVPLVALNEVGGEPGHPPAGPETFHAENAARQALWPGSMVATATHDTKRGEDTRARLCVLSEMPRVWADRVRRWRRLAAPLRTGEGPEAAPEPADELLIYQTVVGAWPPGLDPGDRDGLGAFRDRVAAYMEKAIREAKARTSWAVNDPAYEEAVAGFVTGLFDPDRPSPLLGELAAFAGEIAEAGAVNGLAQTTLKLTVPGLPDLYQGTEFWDFSLVDPDNRRPVDFDGRTAAHAALEAAPADAALAERVAAWRDGRIKQAVVARLLALRAAHPALFADGDYRPLAATGEAPDRVVAFARSLGASTLLVAVPRLIAGRLMETDRLAVDWGDTALDLSEIDGSTLADALTGARHTASGATPMAALTAAVPVFVGLAGP